MLTQKETVMKLKDFGLNSYESKLWAALLSKGAATAGELSDIANVPRSRSYDVLESLEKKGFVILKIGKPIKYVALPPEHVLDNVRKRVVEEAEAQAAMISKLKDSDVFGELASLYTTGIDSVDPSELSGILKGRKNIHNYVEKAIKSASKFVIVCATPTSIVSEKNVLKSSLKKLKKGVKAMVAVGVGSSNDASVAELSEYADVRSTPNKARFYVIDGKEMVFMLTDGASVNQSYDSAVWIRSPFFVEAFSKLFVSAWPALKKI